MNLKIINNLTLLVDNIVPEKYLSKLQEFLLSGAIFTDASRVLAILIIFIVSAELILTLTVNLLNLPVSILILPLFILPGLFTYIIVQQEKEHRK